MNEEHQKSLKNWFDWTQNIAPKTPETMSCAGMIDFEHTQPPFFALDAPPAGINYPLMPSDNNRAARATHNGNRPPPC